MKKSLVLLLALSMLLVLLSACSETKADTPATESTAETTSSTATATQPTTEPPTTNVPSTKPPTTEPSAPPNITDETTATESDRSEQSADAFVEQYLGRWYLEGHSDVYVDFYVVPSDSDKALHYSTYNFNEHEGGRTPRYIAYPAKYCLEHNREDDIWIENGCAGSAFPYKTLKMLKEHLEINDVVLGGDFVSFGNRKFVRNQGTKNVYDGTCYPEVLGTWYMENNSEAQIKIFVRSEHESSSGGDYVAIYSANFDLISLSTGYEYSSTAEGWACLKSFWNEYGITVNNDILTVSNSSEVKTFYRYVTGSDIPEDTDPPEPPTTEPPTTEPPTTEPPTTEPPTTEPPTTEPPTTEPVSYVLIISDTRTISDQTINSDVYITSTGVATFNNVTVNGNIYCYGQLVCSDCTANNVYAYAYGSMMSCGAFDGTHGKISGGINCDNLTILDNALDYAFNKWGKK